MIEIIGVTHAYTVGTALSYETVNVLRSIDLTIYNKEVLGLVGESGCGKSTLSRLILGIESPSMGTIHIDGRAISSYGRLERARLIQPVFQDPYSSLNPRMTVESIISAPLKIQSVGNKRSRRETTYELMAAVGLPPRLIGKFPSQMSGGQRQRVAIARALAIHPKVLIFDEPTSALDVSVQAQVLNLISSVKQQFNLTIVFISHDLAVVNYLADHVAVMRAGEIVEYGLIDDVFLNAKHTYTKSLLESTLIPEVGQQFSGPTSHIEI